MNPFVPLKYKKPLMDLKARIAEQGSKAVFSPLIVEYILNNPHRVTVEMQVKVGSTLHPLTIDDMCHLCNECCLVRTA